MNFFYDVKIIMKILVINWQDIKNPLGGGAEVHMHEIFKRVAGRGHDVTIYCCEVENEPAREIIDGIKIIRYGNRSLFNYTVKKMYRERFRLENFDIVFDDINKIPFYTPRFVKEPLIAISHHFFGKSIFRETNFVSGMYVYMAEKLVDKVYKNTPFAVVSQSTLNEFIERGFDRKNFTIVPNAIEPTEYPMAVGDKDEVPVISYFGRLKKYKSVDHLVRAFYLVRDEYPDAKLHILGKGDFLQELKELAENLNIDENTRFFGYVTDKEKIRLLSRAWCMVNTSMKEGWGITNIEANACGTPVISADSPGLRDSVKSGLSGLLYEYGNVNQLADILIKFIADKEERVRLYGGAVEWASTFSWDKSADIILELSEKVIRNFKK